MRTNIGTTFCVVFALLQLSVVFIVDAARRNRRIVDGVDAPQGKYPWLVLIVRQTPSRICGGVLVDTSHIVTGAHCKYNSGDEIVANIGVYYANDSTHAYNVSGVRNHPDFEMDNVYHNDIAVLRLATPVSEDYPTIAYDVATVADCSTKRKSKLMGWGRTIPGVDQFPNNLQEGNNVTIIDDRNQCKNAEGNIQCPFDTQICAQDPALKQDSAKNDCGGPMLIEKDGKLVFIGTVSYGVSSQVPSCFTCVPSFREWIKEQIDDKSW